MAAFGGHLSMTYFYITEGVGFLPFITPGLLLFLDEA